MEFLPLVKAAIKVSLIGGYRTTYWQQVIASTLNSSNSTFSLMCNKFLRTFYMGICGQRYFSNV